VIDFGHQVRNVRTLNGNDGPDPKNLVLTGYVVISAENKESTEPLPVVRRRPPRPPQP